jgi:large subunit ribosomal protein L10
MRMKDVDNLRLKIRDNGGRANVVKNTLMELALQQNEMHVAGLTGTTLAGYSADDAPGLAKTFVEVSKSDLFKLKGGYLDGKWVTAEEIKILADLPPLPVMRARILGILNAPASKLVRTLAEPARQIAAVVKAFSEQGAAQPA